ncbi:MAG TPA: hypothetical protein DCY27_11685 [Desulfobacterales bacterium]|nr:hypothetical protein [Desulfobacterales bacterium]
MLTLVPHWVNVVILAKFHNPTILNPDFLERNAIVPKGWKTTEVLATPPFATIRYEKNIVILLDQERFEIKKECKSFQDNYEIHGIASKYVTILPHVPYNTIGLNWNLSVKMNEPERFLSERFIKSEALQESELDFLQSYIRLSFNVDNAIFNIDFAPGRARVTGEDYHPAIIINVNFHYKGPFSIDQIILKINQWKAREDFFKNIIPKMLGIQD